MGCSFSSFVYFWLGRGLRCCSLSLVGAGGCVVSVPRLLIAEHELWGAHTSAGVVLRVSCPSACGPSPTRDWNLSLNWKADSKPLTPRDILEFFIGLEKDEFVEGAGENPRWG